MNLVGSRVAPSRLSIAGRRDAPRTSPEIAAEFVLLKIDVIVTNGKRRLVVGLISVLDESKPLHWISALSGPC